MIDDPLVKTLLTNVVEDESNLPIVKALNDGIETDEEIAKETGIKLNIVRKILYRLYDMGLASYKRSKDPETQWFTYSWKFETEEVISRIIKDSKVIIPQHKTKSSKSSGHLYLARIKDITPEQRNEIIIKMEERGISTNVHYKPLPLLTAYKNLGFDIKDYPNAHNLFKNEISLPIYSKLTDEEVDYITENLLEVLQDY